jgi:hypothetical protein
MVVPILLSCAISDKAMNMIGHDDVSTDGDALALDLRSKCLEPGVHSLVRKHCPAPERVERDKVNRSIIGLKYSRETMRLVGVSSHGESVAGRERSVKT